MKKILLTLVAMLAVVGMKAQEGNVNMYIEVESTSDVKNIPVNLYLDNDVELVGYQVSFALPDGLTKENFIYDEDEEFYFILSDRAAKNHIRNSKNMFTASHPNDLLANCISDNGTKLKGNSGVAGTFHFDASPLADGEYEVRMYDAFALPSAAARYDAGGYHTPDQSADYKPFEYAAKFTIANGTVVGINAVKVNADVQNGIYNIQGQRMNGLQKGINIVNGQKVIVK